jgi:hypothetical protein
MNKEIYSSFCKDVRKRALICIGAGRAFQTALRMMSGFSLVSKVSCVVDNSPVQQGQELTVFGRHMRISSLEELSRQFSGEEVLFLITCRARDEIEKQIAGNPHWKGTPVYWYQDIDSAYAWFRTRETRLPGNLRKTENQVIPKILHYCWFGGGEIPPKHRVWMKSWKKYCPDWEIRRWDESNYDVYQNAYIGRAYRAGKWAFVSDFARLDVVERYGGVYLDTDVELVRPFTDFLYQEGFAGYESDGYVNTGLGFGARAHLPIVQEFVEDYRGRVFEDFQIQHGYPNRRVLTSPVLQTAVLERHGLQPDAFRLAEVSGLTLYPVPVLDGMLMDGTRFENPNVYSLHHYAASWLDAAD